jgi:phage gp46-like protein
VLQQGEIIGIWTGRKKSKGIEAKISLWEKTKNSQQLQDLAEEYAAFRQQKLVSVEIG